MRSFSPSLCIVTPASSKLQSPLQQPLLIPRTKDPAASQLKPHIKRLKPREMRSACARTMTSLPPAAQIPLGRTGRPDVLRQTARLAPVSHNAKRLGVPQTACDTDRQTSFHKEKHTQQGKGTGTQRTDNTVELGRNKGSAAKTTDLLGSTMASSSLTVGYNPTWVKPMPVTCTPMTQKPHESPERPRNL